MNRKFLPDDALPSSVDPQSPSAALDAANIFSPDNAALSKSIVPEKISATIAEKPLAPPDCHYLNAAQGWLGLGDTQSALDELELIDRALRFHSDVLAVRCEIYTVRQQWSVVVEIASKLVELNPDRPSGWVRRSFALHELKLTQQAFDFLLPAANKFPDVSTIPYNLACYCAQLGGLEEARHWLQRSCEIGNAEMLQLAARCDPDLSPLFVNAIRI